LAATIVQPAERSSGVGEDATVVAGDHRLATATPFERTRHAIITPDRAAVQRGLDHGGGERLADGNGDIELGILVQPAVEGGKAYREDAREIRILGAEATEELRLAGEVGLVAGGSGHGIGLPQQRGMLNRDWALD